MNIYYSKTFQKQYKKLPLQVKLLAEKKESIFRLDPYDPSLKTHKLTGELKDNYAFSISYHWRIVFHFEEDKIIFDAVGTHEVYK